VSGVVAFAGAGVPVAFRTLGCKVNRVESDAIAADLLGRGVRLASEDEAAVIVINTCTVTGEADAKARKAVRQALRAASSPVVVVTGCLAVLDADALAGLGERVVVEADKAQVAHRVAALLDLGGRASGSVVRTGGAFRTRAMLKIEDGCDNFCSYCIVPFARGVPRAVPLAEAVADAEALAEAGVREIVLTGINIGRYRDAATGADLAALVDAIARTGVTRLRLSSIEPPDLSGELLATLARTRAVCEHIHVPLQSGSDVVLKAMGRAYTAEQYASWIEEARAAIPGLAVTTDVIAGFPGETDAHHAETLAFVERVGFAKLHVFRFSSRPGTPAAEMRQVPPEARAHRAAELRDLGDVLRDRYVSGHTGSKAEVLVERVRGGVATGTTRDYLHVSIPSGHSVGEGDLIEMLLPEHGVR
jgi:threonylcarbamoyladenosine tRNA methylthiotransferase MtaB